MLAIENLEVVYQDVILVLRGVSLKIKKGEIASLTWSQTEQEKLQLLDQSPDS